MESPPTSPEKGIRMFRTDAPSLEMALDRAARVGVAVALLRHGRTAWNATRRFQGRSDVPLDPEGMAQVERLAPRLRGRFDRVYCSPLQRARQTAHPIDPEAVCVEDLAEIDMGELEGRPALEVMESHPAFLAAWGFDPTSIPMPGGGETMRAVQRRGVDAVLRLSRAHPGGRILLVTHQMVIAAIGCHAAGAPLRRWRDFSVGNGEIAVLGVSGDRVGLVALRVEP